MAFIAGLTLQLMLFLSTRAATVPENLPRPLQARDLTNGTLRVKMYNGRLKNCLAENVTYHRILGASPKWRIPHSLISMDGVRCGTIPINASERILDGDAWMDVFPYELIASQRAAQQSGMIGQLVQFREQETLRDYVSLLARDLGKQRARQEIFLGFEGNKIRTCGKVRVPLNSFVVFARNTNETVNFGSLLHGVKNVKMMLSKGVPYHIQFAQPLEPGSTQRFCPYLLPKDYNRAYPIRACFPAGARVRLLGGREVRMDRLRIGDRVAFVDEMGRVRHSPVVLFTHRDGSSTRHEFVQIGLQSGETVALSPGHFVDEERTAASIAAGDHVRTADGSLSRVVSVQRIQAQGLYNPHPLSGHLIVDGVSVTAYTRWLKPAAAHAALLPFRVGQVGEGWGWRKISVRLIRLLRAVVAQGHVLVVSRSGF